jgi:hypothetical protein
MTYQQFPILGPFQGIVSDLPAPNKPHQAFDNSVNFVYRKGRIQSRPRLNDFGAPPDGAIVRYMQTFESIVSTFHTLVLTTQHAYYLNAGGTYNILTMPGAIPSLANAASTSNGYPFSAANIINRVYFSNGCQPLMYADGSQTLIDANTGAAVSGGIACRYMTVLASRLILGYTTEPVPGQSGSTEFTYRIRWCVSGNPDDWTGFGSGFADVLEVPDRITGLVTLGRNAYLFRKNGISIISPTGDGLSPFAIENFSILPSGVGSVFPYALASYGNIAAFISNSEVFSFNGVELTPLAGGKVKKALYADLALAQTRGYQILGFIVANMGLSYDFLSYWICLAGEDLNIAWVYNFDEQTWQKFNFIGAGAASFVGTVATT